MNKQILNSKGQPVLLNAREQARADALQAQFGRELQNALGFEIPITTLTQISKSIIEQKFFTLAPADYMPVRVGEGAWAKEILTYRDFQVSGDFETGIINTGASDSRLAESDGGVDAVTNPIINWAKQITWSMFDLQMAARSGNWDLVTSKEKSRKRNWDLGIQSVAFLGSKSTASIKGLLTQSTVTANTAVITKYIKSMTAAEFQAFVQAVLEAYRSNAARTVYPTHFTIPEADYNGLAVATDENYAQVSKLKRLQEAFSLITRNPNFKIQPCAYADQVNNATVTGLNKNRYTLMNYDEDSLRMDIPVDYTNTLQNTINGFNFQNVGYGQFTGVLAYRPAEMIYFDF